MNLMNQHHDALLTLGWEKFVRVSNCLVINQSMGLPWWLNGKEFTCQCRTPGFDPQVRKMTWRRKWQPISSSILSWKIPWTEEPNKLWSIGSQKSLTWLSEKLRLARFLALLTTSQSRSRCCSSGAETQSVNLLYLEKFLSTTWHNFSALVQRNTSSARLWNSFAINPSPECVHACSNTKLCLEWSQKKKNYTFDFQIVERKISGTIMWCKMNF